METASKMVSVKSEKNGIQKNEKPYPQIIEQLKLQEYYPQKLTREDALAVSKSVISTDDLMDLGKIPWFILQNLIMCDYEGRCFKVRKNRPIANTLLALQIKSEETNSDNNTVLVSPTDTLIAIFWCCDNFLRQILVEKLAMCQLAIPLFLPIDYKPLKMELLLWAMSSLKKQWKKSSGSSCEALTMHRFPNVSAIRLGRPHISKSRILNNVISHLKHDIFFQSECNGGTLKRNISNGLLEMTWYFPNGENNDYFSEALTFMNLRGNASRLQGQTNIISKISLVTIVFMYSNNLEEEDVNSIELLKKQNGHLIIILDREMEKHLKQLLIGLEPVKRENRYIIIVSSSGKSESDLSEEIRCYINRLFKGKGRNIVPDRSIEMLVEIIDEKASACSTTKLEANKMFDRCNEADIERTQFVVDENTPKCSKAKSKAKEIFRNLKETQLPLQSIAIEIGERNRDQYRLKTKRNMQTFKYIQDVQSDINELRNRQKNKLDEDASILELFKGFCTDPLLVRYFRSYVNIIAAERINIGALQPIHQKYIKKKNEMGRALPKNQNMKTPLIESEETELDYIEGQFVGFPVNFEYFIREIGQVYEMESQLKTLSDSTSQLPVIAAKMLLNGHPLELMYANASYVPLTWIEAVLNSLQKILGNTKMFVLSVLGVKNSGKSTLLNTMFGLQFEVSVGTKGAFAQLLPVNPSLKQSTGFKYILVVDTEGLCTKITASTVQRNHDNELATFVIGLADVTIINIMGENTTEMQDILQIAVHAFIKMKNVGLNIKPSCVFVHQNITDVAASDKNTTQRLKMEELLDELTKSAAENEKSRDKYQKFSDVIHFREDKHVMYVCNLWKGDPPMAPPNPGYSRTVLQVKNLIIALMQDSDCNSLEDFKCRFSDLWKAILNENVLFSLKSTTDHATNAITKESTNYHKISCYIPLSLTDRAIVVVVVVLVVCIIILLLLLKLLP